MAGTRCHGGREPPARDIDGGSRDEPRLFPRSPFPLWPGGALPGRSFARRAAEADARVDTNAKSIDNNPKPSAQNRGLSR